METWNEGERVAELVRGIANAMWELSDLWGDRDVADFLEDVGGFPFSQSFDAVASDWNGWAHEVRSTVSTVDICPVCEVPSYKWSADGCSCWLCSVCMTTNREGGNECRSCHTSFCTDCGCVIEWHEPSMNWHGDHVDGCFMA